MTDYESLKIDSQVQFTLPEKLAEDFEEWWRDHKEPRLRSKAEAMRYLMIKAITESAANVE